MRRRTKVTKQLAKKQPPSFRSKLARELIDIEMKLQDSFTRSTNQREQKAIEAIKQNPKYFFSYVKKLNKSRPDIGPLLDESKQFVTNYKDMAEILSHQYSSVFSTPTSPLLAADELFASENDEEKLLDFDFSADDLIQSIDEISENAAAGPDGFAAIFLKQCKQELATPLYTIWRECLDQGITPVSAKTSNIVPIHKGESTALPANYRPVALTSHLVKIFEKVVRSHIINHLEQNGLLNPTQHGFRAGRSCLSQLIAHYDKILSMLDQGLNVDVIYLDFAKAFDKLDFNVTLRKLKDLGIDGKVGRWIHSFLTNRTQTVIVSNEKSAPAPVISGVPQGSVIGPLLFLVLIGDIDQDVRSSFLSSFADDTRIGHGIASPECCKLLQEDLEMVYKWAESNNMEFNSKKFELLRYGGNQQIKETTSYLSNTGEEITVKNSTRDLGVVMSSTGEFKDHITQLLDTVRDLSHWILRSFKSRSPTVMLQLWKSLVIPRLDYCSQLWNPNQVGLIQKIENLQRSFVRHIAGQQDNDYVTSLAELGLYSLQRRRERYQIIYLWSIMEKYVPNIQQLGNAHLDLIRAQSSISSIIGRTLHIGKVGTGRYASLRYSSFPFNCARLFNNLPKNIRNLTNCSKDRFKRTLDDFLRNVPDQPLLLSSNYPHQIECNSLLNLAKHHISSLTWPRRSGSDSTGRL